MTSQNNENNNRSSSPTNNNTIVGQSVLMKEKSRNQINNKNILLLNRSAIVPSYHVRNPSLIQITPTTSSDSLNKETIAIKDDTFFDSDVELFDECDDVSSEKKSTQQISEESKLLGSLKKETPLLQIFDGNVIISQELSIEEIQNLLVQINSKLQNQSSVNSTDFPNISFSKEENSDVEIVLQDGSQVESGSRSRTSTTKVKNLLGKTRSGSWIGQTLDSTNRKALLKSLAVSDQVGELLSRPSTSSETNVLISFKTIRDRKSGSRDFEHDYSSSSAKLKTAENGNSKQDEPMVEHVIVKSTDPSELMQIELIETSSGTVSASTVSSSNCTTDKV